MAMSPEPARGTDAVPARRRAARRGSRRSASGRRSFTSTLRTLDDLAASGVQVSIRVDDLDRGTALVSGDDHVALPVSGLGVVPLLVEVAARFEEGTLDPADPAGPRPPASSGGPGIWRHLNGAHLTLGDAAVLAAAAGDAAAANALLERVSIAAVRARLEALGMTRSAVMDGFRDVRGPDDPPNVALGTTAEYAGLFAELADSRAVSPQVSAQVVEWLGLGMDLTLAASASGVDPFAHDADAHGLLLFTKTGRDPGILAEAGVLAGPHAGLAYALTVCFDDLSILHRMRAHEAFRVLGADLMEYVF